VHVQLERGGRRRPGEEAGLRDFFFFWVVVLVLEAPALTCSPPHPLPSMMLLLPLLLLKASCPKHGVAASLQRSRLSCCLCLCRFGLCIYVQRGWLCETQMPRKTPRIVVVVSWSPPVGIIMHGLLQISRRRVLHFTHPPATIPRALPTSSPQTQAGPRQPSGPGGGGGAGPTRSASRTNTPALLASPLNNELMTRAAASPSGFLSLRLTSPHAPPPNYRQGAGVSSPPALA
jgi:hypothetical protein